MEFVILLFCSLAFAAIVLTLYAIWEFACAPDGDYFDQDEQADLGFLDHDFMDHEYDQLDPNKIMYP